LFFADSAYRYLVIGKFDDGGNLDLDELSGCKGLGSYYFIDDVGVRRMPDAGFLGPDVSTCLGDTVVLDASIPDAGYEWQDGYTGSIYRALSTGIYEVQVQILGCFANDEVEVIITDPPMPDLRGDTFICEGGSLLEYNVEDQGDRFLWQDGSTNPYYVVQEPGFYWVEVINSCGMASDSIEVGLEDCECHIQLPSAFTPNGDGLNDYFEPIYDCLILGSHMKIFNRWGKPVFMNEAVMDRWDGRIKGKMVPEGVYFWVFEYEGWIQGKPRKRRLTGSVTILR
jgi:gliding motility-associated-like protein